MAETKKPIIGLSWEPKFPSLSSTASASTTRSASHESQLWKSNTELVDGLFVPPKDPRKLNKLLKKQVKDTAGASWYVVSNIQNNNTNNRSFMFLMGF